MENKPIIENNYETETPKMGLNNEGEIPISNIQNNEDIHGKINNNIENKHENTFEINRSNTVIKNKNYVLLNKKYDTNINNKNSVTNNNKVNENKIENNNSTNSEKMNSEIKSDKVENKKDNSEEKSNIENNSKTKSNVTEKNVKASEEKSNANKNVRQDKNTEVSKEKEKNLENKSVTVEDIKISVKKYYTKISSFVFKFKNNNPRLFKIFVIISFIVLLFPKLLLLFIFLIAGFILGLMYIVPTRDMESFNSIKASNLTELQKAQKLNSTISEIEQRREKVRKKIFLILYFFNIL